MKYEIRTLVNGKFEYATFDNKETALEYKRHQESIYGSLNVFAKIIED